MNKYKKTVYLKVNDQIISLLCAGLVHITKIIPAENTLDVRIEVKKVKDGNSELQNLYETWNLYDTMEAWRHGNIVVFRPISTFLETLVGDMYYKVL